MENISKKALTLVFTLCLTVASAFAQDIIVMRNSTEIKAKIRNIGQNEITYSKWSNQDGPTYTISKSEVRYIQYANGEKDVFENTRPTVSANGSYSATGNYSGNGSYSAANTGTYGNTGTANSSVGSYTAGSGVAAGNFSVSSSNAGSSINNSPMVSANNLQTAYSTNRPKGSGMKSAGEFLTVFGLTYSGILFIVGAATGEESCYDIALPGLPLALVGIPLWIAGASKMKKSTQTLTYVPVVERTVELGDLALVPSVGVTSDMLTNRQSISAGLTLKF